MRNIALCNESLGFQEEVKIPVLDRSVYFGDGVYDASYSVGGKILFLGEHLDRFFASCEEVSIKPPFSRQKLTSILNHLASLSDEEAFVYWQLSRGIAPRAHAADGEPSLLIMLTAKKLRDVHQKYRLITYPDLRHSLCRAKTLNLLPNVLASVSARQRGCDEAVFHLDGVVTECAYSNISILRHGTLISAPPSEKVLDGITRRHLLGSARALGIPVEERRFSLNELFLADEIIVTSSGAVCMGVSEIDRYPVGGKNPLLLSLLQQDCLGLLAREITKNNQENISEKSIQQSMCIC